MKEYTIEAKNLKKDIYPSVFDKEEININNDKLSFSNYYMKVNDKPFYAISGEIHFSRLEEDKWEDEIIKMKMGGINIISSYIFWIHHEEIEDEFDWSGNKNLRKFIKLCEKHDMFVIIRIGPFVHGESRNGGFPDWLFGRPFDLRENDEEYLKYTERFFSEISKQIQGLTFKNGGPIIATQLENEHEHASAPWEMTTENSKEWTVSGRDGEDHIRTLKEIAVKVGIETPFYTATAWGGATAPTDTVLPLWGGYAFRPWIFYGDIKEHPPTKEFLFKDYHNNNSPEYYNFDPTYNPEDIPFACCEMGGGMTVFYKYRFQLPYESVASMSLVKAAGGCNFLGYYMYHGGSNPKGKKSQYLNENAVPKISYDYQAPIGEFGQIRKSYKMLKLQHLFYKKFENLFCNMKTVLPDEAIKIKETNTETLRYSLRANEDMSGFLFMNNYQDHIENEDQNDFAVNISFEKDKLRIPKNDYLNLEKNKSCILPFNINLNGVLLKYSTTQLITKLKKGNEYFYFFFVPAGMKAEYCLDNTTIKEVLGDNLNIKKLSDESIIKVSNQNISNISVKNKNSETINICTINEKEAENFWEIEYRNKKYIIITEATVLPNKETLKFECIDLKDETIKIFPELDNIIVDNNKKPNEGKESIFGKYKLDLITPNISFEIQDKSTINEEEQELKRPVEGSPISTNKIVNKKINIKFNNKNIFNYKDVLLQVDYQGDIGYAFISGELIHDNFYNGDTWEISLKKHKADLLNKGMYIYISPQKNDSFIKSDSSMAARFEVAKEQIANIKSIKAKAVYDINVEL